MNRSRFFILILFLCSLNAGCLTTSQSTQASTVPAIQDRSSAPRESFTHKPPPWFDNKNLLSGEYPKTAYILGMGSSRKSYEESKSKALEDMARQFSVKVKGDSVHVTSRKIESDGKATAVFVVSDSTSGVKVEVNLQLEGVEFPKNYFDDSGKTFYSLAVLDRASAAARLKNRIQTARAHVLEIQNQGTRWEGQIRIVEAAEKFFKAAEGRKRLDKLIEVYQFIRNDYAPYPPDRNLPTSLVLEENAANLLNGLDIRVTGGDNQKALAGKPLPKPLMVKAVWRGKGKSAPAPGIPITFHYDKGEGEVEGEKWTGDDGMVRNRVREVKKTPGKNHRIAVAFNTEAMLKGFDRDHPRIRKVADRLKAAQRFISYTVQWHIPTLQTKPEGLENGIRDLAGQLVKKLGELGANKTLMITGVSFREHGSDKRYPFSRLVESDLKRYLGTLEGIVLKENTERVRTLKRDLSLPEEQEISGSITGYYKKTRNNDMRIDASLASSQSINLGSGMVMIKSGDIDPGDFKLTDEGTAFGDQQETRPDDYKWSMERLLSLKRENPGFDFKIWTDREEYEIRESKPYDKVKIFIKSERPGYLYLFDIGTSGNLWMLFPNERMKVSNKIEAGRTIAIPGNFWKGVVEVHGPQGEERIKAVLTPNPMDWGALDKTSGFRRLKRGNTRGLEDLSGAMDRLSGDWAEDTASFYLRK